MVSRSLEKMMLIAVGLSTAVIIGVPVLLLAIDTMSSSSHLQTAHLAADEIFNGVRRVDDGELNTLSIQVQLPSQISVDVSGNTLTIGILLLEQFTSWNEIYDHPLVLGTHPSGAGNYEVQITMVSEVIQITFNQIAV